MPYIKQTWIDNESPLTADRMNHIEDGIESTDASVTALDSRISNLAGGGQPIVVTSADQMTDNTKIYLYMGDEEGYESGHWYYYTTEWTDGGQYGADGGVNNNARNLLKYILERVVYTETGMDVYVNALYDALAQTGGGGGGTTTYIIMNVLTNVTNSNVSTYAEEGDSYTGTLTPDTDYSLGTVTVTMGGNDITSTAYDSATGIITISSVTGDITITAEGISAHIIYQLPQETTFDGSNWIDTLVTPFATTNDLTIAFDVTPSSATPNLSCIYRCGEPRFVKNNSLGYWQLYTGRSASTNIAFSNLQIGKRSKCVITRTNSTSYTINIATEDGTTYTDAQTLASDTTTNTLYVAKNQGNSDSYNFRGTMYDFEIIDYAWTSAEIADYLTF